MEGSGQLTADRQQQSSTGEQATAAAGAAFAAAAGWRQCRQLLHLPHVMGHVAIVPLVHIKWQWLQSCFHIADNAGEQRPILPEDGQVLVGCESWPPVCSRTDHGVSHGR